MVFVLLNILSFFKRRTGIFRVALLLSCQSAFDRFIIAFEALMSWLVRRNVLYLNSLSWLCQELFLIYFLASWKNKASLKRAFFSISSTPHDCNNFFEKFSNFYFPPYACLEIAFNNDHLPYQDHDSTTLKDHHSSILKDPVPRIADHRILIILTSCLNEPSSPSPLQR